MCRREFIQCSQEPDQDQKRVPPVDFGDVFRPTRKITATCSEGKIISRNMTFLSVETYWWLKRRETERT